MDKIRVGVVGVGALGQHHARVYASLPEATLVGVVDPFPGRAEEVAGPLGSQSVSSILGPVRQSGRRQHRHPNHLHAEIGEQFLKEGVHVLVEKPIAHTLEDADRLIQAAQGKQSRASGWASRTFQSCGRALARNCAETAFFRSPSHGTFFAAQPGYRCNPGSDDSRSGHYFPSCPFSRGSTSTLSALQS